MSHLIVATHFDFSFSLLGDNDLVHLYSNGSIKARESYQLPASGGKTAGE